MTLLAGLLLVSFLEGSEPCLYRADLVVNDKGSSYTTNPSSLCPINIESWVENETIVLLFPHWRLTTPIPATFSYGLLLYMYGENVLWVHDGPSGIWSGLPLTITWKEPL